MQGKCRRERMGSMELIFILHMYAFSIISSSPPCYFRISLSFPLLSLQKWSPWWAVMICHEKKAQTTSGISEWAGLIQSEWLSYHRSILKGNSHHPPPLNLVIIIKWIAVSLSSVFLLRSVSLSTFLTSSLPQWCVYAADVREEEFPQFKAVVHCYSRIWVFAVHCYECLLNSIRVDSVDVVYSKQLIPNDWLWPFKSMWSDTTKHKLRCRPLQTN